MDNREIVFVTKSLEFVIGKTIEEFQKQFTDVEIHAIKVDGKFNYATQKLEYHIYADVREAGQIFLGMSS